MWLTFRGSVCAILLLGTSLPGQFINRATFLGIEDEALLRSISPGGEYYLDRMSFVVPAPWRAWDVGVFNNGIYYALGSTATDQFTIEGNLNLGVPIGSDFTFRYNFLQSENRDTRFIRNQFEAGFDVSRPVNLFVAAEPFATKGDIDVSAGVLYQDGGTVLRFMATAVDFAAKKSSTFTYDKSPYALMLSGLLGESDGHQWRFELDTQLPLSVREIDSGDSLDLQRYIALSDLKLRLGERDWLTWFIEGEYTQKAAQPASTSAEDSHDRGFLSSRLEWWRRSSDVVEWSIGGSFLWQDERTDRPGDPAAELEDDRAEAFGIGRVHIELSDTWSIEPQLFAGYVNLTSRLGSSTNRDKGFQSKGGVNVVVRFSEAAVLVFIPTVEIDNPGFGGAGAQFVATF